MSTSEAVVQGGTELMFKIIMIGDAGIGKSSLLNRYIRDEFDADYRVTIGIHIVTKVLSLTPSLSRWTKTSESDCKFGTQPVRKASGL